ncbi:hypothetical protein SKAU_G00155210 [Synaphobranchus kaupii]|uniref:Uncharacterized protein n=1 Tax=Synaphobranchus kaupii TaxID=118154 RepID=A0A9Q1IYA5_SYNKA|nr:hypothetical protein SKAU_G00155210 [Synaphobranchus kaupii]
MSPTEADTVPRIPGGRDHLNVTASGSRLLEGHRAFILPPAIPVTRRQPRVSPKYEVGTDSKVFYLPDQLSFIRDTNQRVKKWERGRSAMVQSPPLALGSRVPLLPSPAEEELCVQRRMGGQYGRVVRMPAGVRGRSWPVLALRQHAE